MDAQFFIEIGHAVRTFVHELDQVPWGRLLSLALLAVLFWIWVRPAVQLLARTVYLPWRLALIRYGMAIGTVLRFFGYGMRAKSLYRAARYRIEAELLDPRPERPRRFLFTNKKEYGNARDRYAREV